MKIIAKNKRRLATMKHIKTLNSRNLKDTAEKGGCGECQASCQSACKTSCTVANQKCAK
jgi:predicted ribosomally synthesized six-cysteine peptide SCIFF